MQKLFSNLITSLFLLLLLAACSSNLAPAPSPAPLTATPVAESTVPTSSNTNFLTPEISGQPTDTSFNDLIPDQTCNSCHGTGPYGEAFPNQAGSHWVHQLPAVGCDVCHDGSGFGSNQHDNSPAPAEVNILAQYSSSKGIASYDPKTMTCSNVSCHGGITTPAWGNDNAIVENLDCTRCHTWQGGEAISITAAGHHEHINSPMERMANITCNYCHDPNLVSKDHYTNINSIEMNGNAGATIYTAYGYNGMDEKSCNGSCHSGYKVWSDIKNPNKPDAVNPIIENPIVPDAVKRVWFYSGIVAGKGWEAQPAILDLSSYHFDPVSPSKKINSISLVCSKQTIFVNESMQLYALAQYDDGTRADISGLIHWEVVNPDLGSVDEQGILTAGATKGTVLVKALEPHSGISVSKPVAVIFDYDNSLDRIEIRSPNLFPVLMKGEEVALYGSGISVNGDQEDYTHRVKWSSSSPAAIVDTTGTVTGVANEKDVVITATDPDTGKTSTYSLSIIELGKDDPVSISIEPINGRFQNKAQINFIATGHFSDGSSRVLEKGEVFWSTEDAWIVPFYDPWSGTTMARDPGTIHIFATDPETGITGSATVTTYQN